MKSKGKLLRSKQNFLLKRKPRLNVSVLKRRKRLPDSHNKKPIQRSRQLLKQKWRGSDSRSKRKKTKLKKHRSMLNVFAKKRKKRRLSWRQLKLSECVLRLKKRKLNNNGSRPRKKKLSRLR